VTGSSMLDPPQSHSGTRVLVLGASGFIGRAVSAALTREKAALTLTVRDPETAREIFCRCGVVGEVACCDLRDAGELRSLLRAVRPQVVYNLAGVGVDPSEQDPDIHRTINSELPARLADAMRDVTQDGWNGQRIVHTGTALEYGNLDGNLSEDSIPKPTTTYGKSKLEGALALENAYRRFGVRAATARLFTVYGPGEHPHRLLPSLFEIAETHERLPLTDGTQKRDFVYVDDVAEGLLRIGKVTDESGFTVNLATGRLTSVREFVEAAARALQIPSHLLSFGELPTRASEMEHLPVSTTKLYRLLNWTPRISIEEGLRKTLAARRK